MPIARQSVERELAVGSPPEEGPACRVPSDSVGNRAGLLLISGRAELGPQVEEQLLRGDPRHEWAVNGRNSCSELGRHAPC